MKTIYRAATSVALVLACCAALGTGGRAADAQPTEGKRKAPAPKDLAPGGKYRHNDMSRPRPPVIDPGTARTPEQPGRPPSDAIVLFDGKDLSAWAPMRKAADSPDAPPRWKVQDGYFEVVPHTGNIQTRQKFGDCQIHIEWATPKEVKGSSQGRGNSGVFLGGFGELQVLDSYGNDTYPDGQAAALYGKYPPLVNASRKPGEWQTYDIVVQLSKVDDKNQVVRPGRITVLHNGVLVHHAVEFPGRQGEFPLGLQDHGNPVRFRNIWLRKLKDYDEDGTPPPPK